MPYCKECGFRHQDDDKFCEQCGRSLLTSIDIKEEEKKIVPKEQKDQYGEKDNFRTKKNKRPFPSFRLPSHFWLMVLFFAVACGVVSFFGALIYIPLSKFTTFAIPEDAYAAPAIIRTTPATIVRIIEATLNGFFFVYILRKILPSIRKKDAFIIAIGCAAVFLIEVINERAYSYFYELGRFRDFFEILNSLTDGISSVWIVGFFLWRRSLMHLWKFIFLLIGWEIAHMTSHTLADFIFPGLTTNYYSMTLYNVIHGMSYGAIAGLITLLLINKNYIHYTGK